MRVERDCAVCRAVTEVLRHWRSVDDLAGIHPIIRIECGLHIAECLIELRTKQLLIQVTARQAVAVLTAHAAAELDHEIRDLIRHRLHDLDIAGVLGVDERPDMETANARVAIVTSAGVVLMNDVAEFHKKFR